MGQQIVEKYPLSPEDLNFKGNWVSLHKFSVSLPHHFPALHPVAAAEAVDIYAGG
jgi:hypothetical protein